MTQLNPQIRERAARIRLILMDVDGVLTDGRIHMTPSGEEGRVFDVKDGHGIRMGIQGELVFGIISGRESPVVVSRSQQLGIEEVHQRIFDKAGKFEEILRRLNLTENQICFIGDDLIDLPILRRCGLSVAPADAVPDVLASVHLVTQAQGGRGAVRELIDLVLRATGQWERVTARYFKRNS